MYFYWQKSDQIQHDIYIPKYYDPILHDQIKALAVSHNLFVIRNLVEKGILEVSTGDEIGKLAYGTGDIPFVRTSDISNWEIKSNPKQGVSPEIYKRYSVSQDVRSGDILLVRDGTYLIGTNCIITDLDATMLYQSHIVKMRVTNDDGVNPYLIFLAFNTDIVQRQIRSIQFTADTIDTIGNRYLDIVLPVPKDRVVMKDLTQETKELLHTREKGRAFIKHCPVIMEEVLATSSLLPIEKFASKRWEDVLSLVKSEAVTSEFGDFHMHWLPADQVEKQVYLPKYYNPEIVDELHALEKNCTCVSIGELIENQILQCDTGDEIGKLAYGTGDVPFVRTSDFANWEIKHDPKQSVSQVIYEKYDKSQDARALDILLVRDGTYLVGNSCIITSDDAKMLYSGGIYKIRVLKEDFINPWLLLGLLNSYVVKRQIRSKQFTRDVIDTLGQRIKEIILPIPCAEEIRKGIEQQVRAISLERIKARKEIEQLTVRMLVGVDVGKVKSE